MQGRQHPLLAPSPDQISRSETFVMLYASVLAGQLLVQPVFQMKGGFLLGTQAVTVCAALPALEAAVLSGVGGGAESGDWSASWYGGYVIAACCGSGGSDGGFRVALWHLNGATNESKIYAMWHASLLRRELARCGKSRLSSELPSRIRATRAAAEDTWSEVHAAMVDAGWDMAVVHLDGDGGAVEVAPGGLNHTRN